MPAKVGGVKAAVGAGTGLGEVFLSAAGGGGGGGTAAPVYVAFPCEGGMTEFLAHDDDEWRLAQWLRREKKCGPREQSLPSAATFPRERTDSAAYDTGQRAPRRWRVS